MNHFPYASIPQDRRKPMIGLIVLQSDETLEPELHQWLPASSYDVLVSRVPSGEEVTEQTLGEMRGHIAQAAERFPRSARFNCVAYCCTSGTAVIGEEDVGRLVRDGCDTKNVITPLSALVKACEAREIKRLAFLSPYIESVSSRLRDAVAQHGIESPVFGSFNESQEAKVAWIDENSIRHGARRLVKDGGVDGVFLPSSG